MRNMFVFVFWLNDKYVHGYFRLTVVLRMCHFSTNQWSIKISRNVYEIIFPQTRSQGPRAW